MLIDTRDDIDLRAFERVAWQGETLEVSASAAARIDSCRAQMEELVKRSPEALYYGVTTGQGDRADVRLTDRERREFETRLPALPTSFGDPFPERVVRGILFARVATFLDGNGGVRSELVRAIAEMLDGRRLPAVPSRGNGGPGEILLHAHLFLGLGERVGGLGLKEPMALINGAPGAAAVAADLALSGRRRLAVIAPILALAAEAMLAPLEHYAQELEQLWVDPHEQAGLRTVRELLAEGSVRRRTYQAPVSFRVIPKVIGQLLRQQEAIEAAATISLRSVTDNPVYVPSVDGHGYGALMSNGSMHDGRVLYAMNALTFCWADVCTLVYHLVERLFHDDLALKPARYTLGSARMVAAGWAQDAQAVARPTLLPLSGSLQSDLGSLHPQAWIQAQQVGNSTDCAIATLAMLSAVAFELHDRAVPPGLQETFATIAEHRAPNHAFDTFGNECQSLASAISAVATPMSAAPSGTADD